MKTPLALTITFAVVACRPDAKTDTTSTTSAPASPSQASAPTQAPRNDEPAPPSPRGSATEIVIEAESRTTGSCSWMPGSKNPNGRAQGVCEILLSNVRGPSPIVIGKPLASQLDLQSAPTRVLSPGYAKSLGACTVTTSLPSAPLDRLTLVVSEPGCESMFLTKERFASELELTAVAKQDGKTLPVRFKLRPAKT